MRLGIAGRAWKLGRKLYRLTKGIFPTEGLALPRRLKDSESRRHQVGVFIRSQDLRLWTGLARQSHMSLSRYIYLRALRAAPMPSRDTLALVGSIGRVGSLLNQIAKIAWSQGLDGTRFSDALALTAEVHRLLRSAAFFGGQ